MVKVFAPVNIAWIKYMGKSDGRPTNSSFSMTLKDLGSETEIQRVSDAPGIQFSFEGSPYCPPLKGQDRAIRFLNRFDIFDSVLNRYGFQRSVHSGSFLIHTSNNVPAGSGIATSASGFAALTLAWFGVLVGDSLQKWTDLYRSSASLRSAIAQVAALGSGSACRSFQGPFVEWSFDGQVRSVESKVDFIDFVLLFEKGEKIVSSSEAHERVKTSPQFMNRPSRAEARLTLVRSALERVDLGALSRTVSEEARDMHELFHTSVPAFRYLTEGSELWLKRSTAEEESIFTRDLIITADAGANIHVFVESSKVAQFASFLEHHHPELQYLTSGAGPGARYVD